MTQRKSDATIEREIRRLNEVFFDPAQSLPVQESAANMLFALEWVLGRFKSRPSTTCKW